MEVEMLGAVVVDVEQGHRVAEERVPVDREVHAARQAQVGLLVEVAVQGSNDPVRLLLQARAVEDHGSAAGTEVVDDVERPAGRVQALGEPSAVSVR